MHVLILGSGVIGTTTAYYLARAGHQVTVIDRQPGPALETSYANAGEVSPGYSAPGALRLSGDETGDCFKFTRSLARLAEGMGAKFHFHTVIERLDFAGGKVTGAARHRPKWRPRVDDHG